MDDHPLIREGVAAMLGRQSDLEVCGEASDVDEALADVLDSGWSAGRTVIQSVNEGSPKVEIVRYAHEENNVYR